MPLSNPSISTARPKASRRSLIAPHLYGGPLAELIGRLKFGGERAIAKPCTAAQRPTSHPKAYHTSRTYPARRSRLRGAALTSSLLARHLAGELSLPVSHSLKRIGTPHSTKLNQPARHRNLRDARPNPSGGTRACPPYRRRHHHRLPSPARLRLWRHGAKSSPLATAFTALTPGANHCKLNY